MKAATGFVSLICVAAFVGTVYGQSVTNSPHNINNIPMLERPDNRVCLPCHTPHNAQTDAGGDSMVLWNHAVTTQTFQMYSPFASGRPTAGQPEGPSKLCLSCHDGVTAIDNYGGTNTSGNVMTMSHPSLRDKKIGTDLRDDHPIGIVYDEGLSDLNPKTGLTGVKLVTVGGVADRVECTSCHDPHNNSLGNFLRLTVAGSLICLECHNK